MEIQVLTRALLTIQAKVQVMNLRKKRCMHLMANEGRCKIRPSLGPTDLVEYLNHFNIEIEACQVEEPASCRFMWTFGSRRGSGTHEYQVIESQEV